MTVWGGFLGCRDEGEPLKLKLGRACKTAPAAQPYSIDSGIAGHDR